MNRSPFGYVVEGDIDKAKFERHVSLNQPISLTIINNHQYAAHLKRNVIPHSEIYIRNVDADGDGNDHTQYTVDGYFKEYAPLTQDGLLGLQFGNEGDFSPATALKLIPFMQEAVKRKIKMSLPGVAVGNTPSAASGWAMYHEFLDYVCHNPAFIALDLHEYFGALPTSGMITKDTQPGDVLYFSHALRTFEQFEKKTEADFTNLYHVGRSRHAFTYAKSKGWPTPVVDIGEFGSDFVKDSPTVEQWLRAIKPIEGVENVDGFRTLRDYWRNQYPTLTPSETYFKFLRWLWENILQPIGVRSTRLFEWNDGKRWINFNHAVEPSVLLWLESYMATPPKPPTTPAPVEPALPVFPADFDLRSKEGLAQVDGNFFIVSAKPTYGSGVVANLAPGVKVHYIPVENLRPEERVLYANDTGTIQPWTPVRFGSVIGWVWAGLVTFKDVPPPPNQAQIEAYKAGLESVRKISEEIGRIGVQLAAARDDLAKALELIRAIEPLIKQSK